MSEGKTTKNLQVAFTAEAKALVRNRTFAEIADSEGYEQIGKLFRAVAEAESVHAKNALRMLGEMKTTEENLRFAFESELSAKNDYYPSFIKEAESEEKSNVALVFSRARDVEERHAQLYKGALDYLVKEEVVDYYVCGVCGYVAEKDAPDECPICQAEKDAFNKVD
jgi:rubrerythrin